MLQRFNRVKSSFFHFFARTLHQTFPFQKTSKPVNPFNQLMDISQFIRPTTITLSPMDKDSTYVHLELENGIDAVIISDPQCDHEAASMNVGVGSFHTPSCAQGLPHFCEHMVFLGSKKYPKEGEYGEIVKQNGGVKNAYTASDHTNFFFQVAPNAKFFDCLDRFAEFFIDPLFMPDAIEREVKAVDSEFRKNLQSDVWRLQRLLQHVCREDHPMHNFSTGNLETLHDRPKREGIDIFEEMINFHKKYYTANRMKLCVVSRHPVDDVVRQVVNSFSPIRVGTPHQPLPPMPLVDTGKIFHVMPCLERRWLRITFPTSDRDELYDQKVSHYYAHLVGDEGPGSILAYLQEKDLATALSAGQLFLSESFSFFSITITLTQKGQARAEDVLEIVFAYINHLKEVGPQERIFMELKQVEDIHFKFQHREAAMDRAQRITERLGRGVHVEDVVIEPYLMRTYSPDTIREFGSHLDPKNAMIVLMSKDYAEMLERDDDPSVQLEPIYETKYKSSALDGDLLERLTTASVDAFEKKLHLPPPNEFIPTDFSLRKYDSPPVSNADGMVFPSSIHDGVTSKVFHKLDTLFQQPRVIAFAKACSTMPCQSAKHYAVARILGNMITEQLNKFAYAASLVDCSFDISVSMDGFVLSAGGFSHKLPVLWDKVIEGIRSPELIEERFERVKEAKLRHVKNSLLSTPYLYALDLLDILVRKKSYHPREMVEAYETVRMEDFKGLLGVDSAKEEATCELWKNVHFRWIVLGNMDMNETLSFVSTTESKLGVEASEKTENPRTMEERYEMDRAINFRKIRGSDDTAPSKVLYECASPNKNEVNSSLLVYLQIGEREFDRDSKILLLTSILQEPFFDQLRTKEQVGYVVFCGWRPVWGSCGVMFLLQSATMGPRAMEGRVDVFFEKVVEMFESLSDETFEQHRTSVIENLCTPRQNLMDEVGLYRTEIDNFQEKFNRRELRAERVAKLTKKEIIETAKELMSEAARLSIRIYGNQHDPATDGDVAMDHAYDVYKDGDESRLHEKYTVISQFIDY
eukprot:TRINITY_DN891_c0_g1_i1.p1 TRINITY_DN891_c0_g1~~TRINITY_DN891_c0_g1_i1.p1  ORF type:complete len:1036 (+),score=270.16 TRINITY_DN891_c0_g1_i1:119-3226(+)